MKQYKLIKEYPGNPYKVDTIVEFSGTNYRRKDSKTMFFITPDDVENYSEFWKEVKQKDYEILEFIFNINHGNSIWKYNKETKNYKSLGDYTYTLEEMLDWDGKKPSIHSVKRLSDNVVFTIGDRIDHVYISSVKGEIKEFRLLSTGIIKVIINAENGEASVFLKSIKHAKQPLFITEDGVDLNIGDTFYSTSINKEHEILVNKHILDKHSNQKQAKINEVLWFSTKKAAEEYIIMNKPCLSFKEVIDYLMDAMTHKEMKQIIKNKLNL